MIWLLFMDESGHDRKQMPYEVRGGVAIQDRRRRSFIRAVESLERDCFGARLADYHREFNGEKLLDRHRLKRAFSSKMHTAPANHERIKKEAKSFPAATRAPGQAEPPTIVSGTDWAGSSLLCLIDSQMADRVQFTAGCFRPWKCNARKR
jgi:hypothetical protein